MHSRRRFLSAAALASLTIENLLAEVQTAAARVEGRAAAEVASDRDFWFTIQQAFSGGRGITNLNNGGVSPSPRIVTEALTRYVWQQEDATAYTMWQILEPQSETVRAGLAKVFGCDKEEIAITRNASESLEILLMGIDLRSGDEIVTTTQDYPRMLTTLDQRERREGIKVKKIQIPLVPRSAGEIAEAFEKAVTPRTRLILVSHMVNITGQITPVRAIAEMARGRGIEVIVDGAHSFAQFAFKRDDLQCDYFGTSLHKWLYAPKGTGMLYVKRDRIEKVWPLMAAEKKQTADIRKFEEIGTHSAAPRLAIGEALLFHHGIGPERKEARLRYLSRYWTSQLRNEPRIRFHTPVDDDAQSCAITTMEIEGIKPADLAAHLMLRHKIFVTPIKHPEFRGIRVTPNVYTTLPELDRFAEVIAQIAKNGIPPEPPQPD
jgi:selenocysteine lyase/cysteine desulfurase